MPFPIIIPIAAGLGWGVGKLAEHNGNKLKDEANSLLSGTDSHISRSEQAYEVLRNGVKQCLADFVDEIRQQRTLPTPKIARSKSTMPANVAAAWDHIKTTEVTRAGSAAFAWASSPIRDARARGMVLAANGQMRSGNPGMAAALDAMALANKGLEHYTACRNYRNAATAYDAETRRKCNELVEKTRSEEKQVREEMAVVRSAVASAPRSRWPLELVAQIEDFVAERFDGR